MEKDCFTSLTIDGQLYEIAKAIDSIDPSGVSGTAYYGQVSRITSGIINIATAGTYQSTGLTATLDSENNGVSLGTTDLFAVKNTSGSAQLLKIYGSADIQSGNNQTLGIKLALNGTPIDNTECNAPTGTGSGNFAKLITNWMIELQPNDEVALFVTDKSTAGNITLLRGRLVASTVGKQGPQGPIGPTGPAGSGGSTDVQIFTSSGTWTKPTGAKSVDVLVIAGGGGGSSGRVNAGITGGGGGAGGGLTFRTGIPAQYIGSTETVTIGAGGPGGASTSSANSQGVIGVSGGDSAFGNYAGGFPLVYAGGGGGGGLVGAAGNANGRNVNAAGGGGSGGSAAAGNAGGASAISAAGGGGGGGANSASFFNGGNGQWVLGNNPIGGQSVSSGIEGATGSNGTSMGTYIHAGGGGSGGVGAYTKNAGAGGNGGLYGGGGGGGGCQGTQNGVLASGAGGNGAQGIVIITTYF